MTSPALQFEAVSIQRGANEALSDVSVTIERGERVAIVGSSGAGKSTFLALANTSLAPTSGTVRILGDDLSHFGGRDLQRVRRRIGTVYQNITLPGPLRVVHNVNAGNLATWSRWRAARSLVRPHRTDVERARLALDRFGIADKLWARTDELSGGERQRVALARLLVQDAQLVLADEPTASLDPARSREVIGLLVSLTDDAADRTLVVSVHSVDLALEYFDRVVALRHGRIAFDLAPDSVDTSAVRALYDTQPV